MSVIGSSKDDYFNGNNERYVNWGRAVRFPGDGVRLLDISEEARSKINGILTSDTLHIAIAKTLKKHECQVMRIDKSILKAEKFSDFITNLSKKLNKPSRLNKTNLTKYGSIWNATFGSFINCQSLIQARVGENKNILLLKYDFLCRRVFIKEYVKTVESPEFETCEPSSLSTSSDEEPTSTDEEDKLKPIINAEQTQKIRDSIADYKLGLGDSILQKEIRSMRGTYWISRTYLNEIDSQELLKAFFLEIGCPVDDITKIRWFGDVIHEIVMAKPDTKLCQLFDVMDRIGLLEDLDQLCKDIYYL